MLQAKERKQHLSTIPLAFPGLAWKGADVSRSSASTTLGGGEASFEDCLGPEMCSGWFFGTCSDFSLPSCKVVCSGESHVPSDVIEKLITERGRGRLH